MLHVRTLPQLPVVFSLVAAALLLQGCGGAGSQVQHVPENGYEQTSNYQFQARMHTDADSTCQQLVVRVEALNKLYLKEKPPSRLQLFDDDCEQPIEFNRVHYVSEETGEPVSLDGSEMTRFWSENERLQHELMGWLARAGLI